MARSGRTTGNARLAFGAKRPCQLRRRFQRLHTFAMLRSVPTSDFHTYAGVGVWRLTFDAAKHSGGIGTDTVDIRTAATQPTSISLPPASQTLRSETLSPRSRSSSAPAPPPIE
jgi:hypothetical protein